MRTDEKWPRIEVTGYSKGHVAYEYFAEGVPLVRGNRTLCGTRLCKPRRRMCHRVSSMETDRATTSKYARTVGYTVNNASIVLELVIIKHPGNAKLA